MRRERRSGPPDVPATGPPSQRRMSGETADPQHQCRARSGGEKSEMRDSVAQSLLFAEHHLGTAELHCKQARQRYTQAQDRDGDPLITDPEVVHAIAVARQAWENAVVVYNHAFQGLVEARRLVVTAGRPEVRASGASVDAISAQSASGPLQCSRSSTGC